MEMLGSFPADSKLYTFSLVQHWRKPTYNRLVVHIIAYSSVSSLFDNRGL